MQELIQYTQLSCIENFEKTGTAENCRTTLFLLLFENAIKVQTFSLTQIAMVQPVQGNY